MDSCAIKFVRTKDWCLLEHLALLDHSEPSHTAPDHASHRLQHTEGPYSYNLTGTTVRTLYHRRLRSAVPEGDDGLHRGII